VFSLSISPEITPGQAGLPSYEQGVNMSSFGGPIASTDSEPIMASEQSPWSGGQSPPHPES